MNFKIIKGDKDYINKKRIRVLIITIIYFVISLGIILVGYLTTGTKKNLLTVVGVLGCLPACKSAVNMIMLFIAKGCSKDVLSQVYKYDKYIIPMYDMYFTSYANNFALSHMVVNNSIILGLSEDPKFKVKECTEHLTTMLKQAGIKDFTISLTNDLNKYITMLDNIKDNKINESEIRKDDEIRISLYEISL